MVNQKKNYIQNRMNSQINSESVRIVNRNDYPDETIEDVVSKSKALKLASDYGVDLIEIAYNEQSKTSICKLIAKDKFLYQEKKKAKEKKAAQHTADLKEIKLGVDIAENDVKTKHNQAVKFLEKGDNVKISLQLRGRHAHMEVSKDKALELVLKFANDLATMGIAKIVNMPTWNNNKVAMQVNSVKK